MKFLVDAQLPPGLCRWLEERGHEALHVSDIAAEPMRDWQIADYAEREGAIVMSKDDDFTELRLPDRFAFIWLRCGNISNRNLREWLDGQWESVEKRLARGARFISLG
jgi:predicted nuclease of predicted toxin-antitoxin system